MWPTTDKHMFSELKCQLKQLTLVSSKIQITNYLNEYNEVSNFFIFIGANYKKIIQNSLEIWGKIKPSINLVQNKSFSVKDLDNGRRELIDSYLITLSGKKNPNYTCNKVYLNLFDKNNLPIPGCKIHLHPGILHLEGLIIDKFIVSPGNYDFKSTTGLILAKNFLRSLTPLRNWRQFAMHPNRFSKITALNTTIKDIDFIKSTLK